MTSNEKEFVGQFGSHNERPVRNMLHSMQTVTVSLEYMSDEELTRFGSVMNALYEQENMLPEHERSNRISNTYASLTRIAEYLLRERRWNEPEPAPEDRQGSWFPKTGEPWNDMVQSVWGMVQGKLAERAASDGNDYIDLTDPDLKHLLVGLRSAGPPHSIYAQALDEAQQVGALRGIGFERWLEVVAYEGGNNA